MCAFAELDPKTLLPLEKNYDRQQVRESSTHALYRDASDIDGDEIVLVLETLDEVMRDQRAESMTEVTITGKSGLARAPTKVKNLNCKCVTAAIE